MSSEESCDSRRPASHLSLAALCKGGAAPFYAQNDATEALAFNGKGLPLDYLLAKLSFTDDLAKVYRKQHAKRHEKLELRLNSEFQFAKADVHNDSECSFNKDLESEVTDLHELHDIESGLDYLVEEFVHKTDFLQGVKDNNKTHTKQRTDAGLTYQDFVRGTLEHGHLPLPILLRIKKGILYIPSSYTVSEGLAFAMRSALKNLEFIQRNQLRKAIFDKNNMSDRVFHYVLQGLKTRPEFMSLNSVSNEIGDGAAKQICDMLKRGKNTPRLQELILVSNKSTPSALDSIMEALRVSTSLRSLTLQDMSLSDR